MPLFEIAVIERKKVKDEDDKERLILAPVCVLAKSDKAAAMSVMLGRADGVDVEALKECEPDELQVIVRPFA